MKTNYQLKNNKSIKTNQLLIHEIKTRKEPENQKTKAENKIADSQGRSRNIERK